MQIKKPVLVNKPYTELLLYVASGKNYAVAIADVTNRDPSPIARQLKILEKEKYLVSERDSLKNKLTYSVNYRRIAIDIIKILNELITDIVNQVKIESEAESYFIKNHNFTQANPKMGAIFESVVKNTGKLADGFILQKQAAATLLKSPNEDFIILEKLILHYLNEVTPIRADKLQLTLKDILTYFIFNFDKDVYDTNLKRLEELAPLNHSAAFMLVFMRVARVINLYHQRGLRDLGKIIINVELTHSLDELDIKKSVRKDVK